MFTDGTVSFAVMLWVWIYPVYVYLLCVPEYLYALTIASNCTILL